MVTAETAVVLPVLLVVLAGAVSALTVVGAQLRCVDAAREAVRAAARGEDAVRVVALARAAAPDGARVTVDAGDGDDARVTVAAVVEPLGLTALGVPVEATAVAVIEPGAAAVAR